MDKLIIKELDEPETLTVVGLPPMSRSEAQKYVKRLQLL